MTFPARPLGTGTHKVRITLVNGPAVYNGTQAVLDSITFLPQ